MKIWYYDIRHFFLQRNLKKRKSANVVFFVSSLAMWRYQGLYELMNSDERFNCKIVIAPFKNYCKEEKEHSVNTLRQYFNSKRIEFIDAYKEAELAQRWFCDFNADILFYPQPYRGLYGNKLDSCRYHHKLLCYIPYGIYTLNDKSMLNSDYQNLAWKVFLQTSYHTEDAKKGMKNKGKNIVLTGEANVDRYNSETHADPWKTQDKPKKRIIWAPHFTVIPNFLLHRDSFLWMYQAIIDFSKEYEDEVQIAFKPHPRLITELYKHPDWGKQRTDKYFELWENTSNLQFESGDFINLFSTSDIMIHDSGSFIADYLYTGKPVIFTAPSKEDAYYGLNEFGIQCMNCHYHAHDTKTAVELLKSVLIEGNDPMKGKRLSFRDSILTFNRNKSVAQTVYDDIISSLGWGKNCPKILR